jgi:hypothetical protein
MSRPRLRMPFLIAASCALLLAIVAVLWSSWPRSDAGLRPAITPAQRRAVPRPPDPPLVSGQLALAIDGVGVGSASGAITLHIRVKNISGKDLRMSNFSLHGALQLPELSANGTTYIVHRGRVPTIDAPAIDSDFLGIAAGQERAFVIPLTSADGFDGVAPPIPSKIHLKIGGEVECADPDMLNYRESRLEWDGDVPLSAE